MLSFRYSQMHVNWKISIHIIQVCSVLNFFKVVFDVERALENTKVTVPEQPELQILLAPPKHGGT